MKIIAEITLVGKDREYLPPGSELNLPEAEAKSLIERGFARLPEAPKKARKTANDDGGDPVNPSGSGADNPDPENPPAPTE